MDILTEYIKRVNIGPQQKSEAWYKIRMTTVGGSEIAAVIGKNPYMNAKKLIAQKIGLSNFHGSIATRWGNLFEPVTKMWAELVLNMSDPIRELGSIDGKLERQRYSPDGLGIVRLLNEDDQYEDFIILFEFKAPFMTLPNGEIPSHYIPQIQTGLLSIDIAEYAIFINNCYRKCCLDDLDFTGDYDQRFHRQDAKKQNGGLSGEEVYACGIIGFYQTWDNYNELMEYLGYDDSEDDDPVYYDKLVEERKRVDSIEYYKDEDSILLRDTEENTLDLGAADYNVMNRLLELYEAGRLHAVYFPILVNDEVTNNMEFLETHGISVKPCSDITDMVNLYLDEFETMCERKEYLSVGILPWKLMRSDIILEERDPNWENIIRDPVKDVLNKLDVIHAAEDKIEKYNEIFNINDDVDEDMASFFKK
jgi:hypothetical protein